MLPRPFRVVGTRQDTRDTDTLELEPVDGAAAAVRGRAVHDAAGVRRRRGADLDQRRPRPTRTCSSTRSATSARSPRPSCAAQPGDVLGVRGPFGTGWEVVGRAAAATSSSSPAASGWRRCARPCSRSVAARRGLRPGGAALRRPDPGGHAVRRRAPALGGRRTASTSQVTVDTASTPGAAGSGWSPQLVARAGVRPGPDAGAGLRPRGDDALRRRRRSPTRGVPPDAGAAVDGAQHEVRRGPVRPLPAARATSSASTARCSATTGPGPLMARAEL